MGSSLIALSRSMARGSFALKNPAGIRRRPWEIVRLMWAGAQRICRGWRIKTVTTDGLKVC